MSPTASCHCGKFKFEMEGALEQVIDYNCLICQRRSDGVDQRALH